MRPGDFATALLLPISVLDRRGSKIDTAEFISRNYVDLVRKKGKGP